MGGGRSVVGAAVALVAITLLAFTVSRTRDAPAGLEQVLSHR